MNQDLQNHSVTSYCAKIRKKRRKVEHEQEMIKNDIADKKEIQRQKEIAAIPELVEKEKTPKIHTSSNSDYYNFFKQNMPSNYTLQAVAVGIAAIAIQNML